MRIPFHIVFSLLLYIPPGEPSILDPETGPAALTYALAMAFQL